MIPRYLCVINDPPCNSAYAAKRLNKRSLLLLFCTMELKILVEFNLATSGVERIEHN